MRYRTWGTIAGAAGLTGLLAACGSSGPASTTAAQRGQPVNTAPTGTMVGTATVAGRKVLTTGSGLTLYWLAPAGKAAPRCDAACAAHWLPARAPAIAGGGVNVRLLGEARQAGGIQQITYAGHLLYLYRGDTRPGTAKGSGLKAPGGVWREALASLKPASGHHAGTGRAHKRTARTIRAKTHARAKTRIRAKTHSQAKTHSRAKTHAPAKGHAPAGGHKRTTGARRTAHA